MGKFFNVILSFALCMLTFNALVIGFPAENEIKDTAPLLEMVTKEVPKSVTSFSLNLLKNLIRSKPEENLLFSPLSVYGAIMMLHLGAADRTRDELSGVLNLSGVEKNSDKVHEAFSEVLRKVQQKVSNTDDRKPETIIANGFFVQKDHHIHESYLQSLQKYYSANATNVNFLEHAGEATETINSFISDMTKQRIQKFYETPLPSTTVAILSSALYFHGIWEHTFNKDHTKMEKFHTGNSEIEVPMMHGQQVIAHSHSDILQLDTIELPYKGGEYSMLVLLPRPSQTIKNMTDHIQLYDAREILQNTKVEGVDYKIPKMKFSWKHCLVKPVGLEDIFHSIDLSRMSEHKFPISDLRHATEIEVDEQGTVASAVTATNVVKSVPPTVNAEYKFYVDRPFVMILLHKPTQMVVFDGVVYRPQQ